MPKKSFYRFALYGTTGSGKTCLLGVMALARTSSRGLSCEYLSSDEPLSGDIPKGEGEVASQVSSPADDSTRSDSSQGAQNNPIAEIFLGDSPVAVSVGSIRPQIPAGTVSSSEVGVQPNDGRQAGDGQKSPPPPRKLSQYQRELRGLAYGRRWIREVMEALKQGSVPRANPAVLHEAPLTLDFRIGDPIRGTWTTRMIDYSGELIDPDLQHDPEFFVRRLRDYLVKCDGFLILAEVPRGHEVDQGIRDHLVRLQEAFASLQEAKDDALRTPVAIIFTKWDRHSEINHNCPPEELRKFRQWLKGHPEYEGLIRSIGHSLLPQERQLARRLKEEKTSSQQRAPSSSEARPVTGEERSAAEPATADEASDDNDPSLWGVKEGNAWLFPVSAFGRSERRGATEIPWGFPKPFGILEPFVWLAERRDELDLGELISRWRRTKFWRWIPFGFLLPPYRRLASFARSLNRRVPRESPRRQKLDRTVRAVRNGKLLSGLITIVTLAGIALGTFSAYRIWEFRRWVRVIEDAETDVAGLQEARDFFTRWTERWNGVLTPPREEAEKYLSIIEQKVDDVLWNRVQTQLPGSERQAQAAEEYLKMRPQGVYALEASRIVESVRVERARQQNAAWLDDLATELEKANTVDDLNKLRDRMSGRWPREEFVTPQESAKLEALRKKLGDRLKELAEAELLSEVRKYTQDGNWRLAMDKLSRYGYTDDAWRTGVTFLADWATSRLKEDVKSELGRNRFADARTRLESARFMFESFEKTVRLRDIFLADRILGLTRLCTQLSEEVNLKEDQYFYQEVQRLKSEMACRRYLEQAPLKTMANSVKGYLDYLKRRDEPLDVVVEVEILWDRNYAPDGSDELGENHISVLLEGETVLQTGPVGEKRGQLSGRLGTFPIRQKRRTESVSILVEIQDHDGFLRWWMDPGGTGQATFSIEALSTGVTIPLRVSGGAFENQARLKIVEGWPHEPPLPAWRVSFP